MNFKDFVNEMSNVPQQGHGFEGLKFHILQPGDKKIRHAPRIKVFLARNPSNYYIISIPDGGLIQTANASFLSTKILNDVLEHIKNNGVEYLKLWNNPYLDWTDLKIK